MCIWGRQDPSGGCLHNDKRYDMKATTTSPEVNKKKKRKEWALVLSRGKQVRLKAESILPKRKHVEVS